MGIEDRLREALRRSARTATGADVLPEDLWQKIQHRIAHRKRGVVVQVETVAVALAASVVTLLWLVIAFTGARDQHLANPTVLSVGARPSQHCGVLTLRSRCFGSRAYLVLRDYVPNSGSESAPSCRADISRSL